MKPEQETKMKAKNKLAKKAYKEWARTQQKHSFDPLKHRLTVLHIMPRDRFIPWLLTDMKLLRNAREFKGW